MASDRARELRQQGIAAAKAGQTEQARGLLQQALRLDPGSEAGWLWLMSIARDQRERLFCLDKLLDINPYNELGMQALASLGMDHQQVKHQLSTAKTGGVTVTKAGPAKAPPQLGGIPMPQPPQAAAAARQAEPLVSAYLTPPTYPGVTWLPKDRRRAGERDALRLRIAIGTGAAVGVLLLFVAGYTVVWNTPSLRGVVFAPTPTYSPVPASPTPTYTPTAGATPTASPTPELTLTPSPTVPANIPNGALTAIAPPTAIYPPVFDRSLADAVALASKGRYAEALPTLEVEVTRVATRFDAAPYYFRAVALIENNQLDAAAAVLQEAGRRLPEQPDNRLFKALVDAGLAYLDLRRAEAGLKAGQTLREVGALLTNVEDRAQAAIAADPKLALPYRVLAQRHSLENRTDQAVGVLDRGLAVAELAANVELIVQKGQVYFDQRDYERAAYQAFLALYIDPAAEPGHLLQIRAALAQGKPGLAVLLAQGYLFYYPGSALGYKLLGDARVAEGNSDLALEAYNQALAGADGPVTVEALVARAALHSAARRYDLARDDLTRAYTLSDDPQVRALRMQAAYSAGSLRVAETDAEALLGTGAVADSRIQLVQARILVDEAAANDTAVFDRALTLLNTAEPNLPASERPTAAEYRARALYATANYNDALSAVNTALAAAETGSRHYLRGLIYEALGQTEAAARDYDWVLAWSEIYPYPFRQEARQRLAALRDQSSG